MIQPVVMISGHGNIETAVNATKLGAFDFIEKPLSIEKSRSHRSENALRTRELEKANQNLAEQSFLKEYEMVGESVAMRACENRLHCRADLTGAF
jgi:two-component system nitrogen regulation response regulator NtrX